MEMLCVNAFPDSTPPFCHIYESRERVFNIYLNRKIISDKKKKCLIHNISEEIRRENSNQYE